MFGYRKDGHWVGFITAIVDDEAVHAMHMGFEPHYAQQSQFYQRSMMDLVRLAMEERKPLLNMGRTATEMKSTMGAMPVENSFVFFQSSPCDSRFAPPVRPPLSPPPNLHASQPFQGLSAALASVSSWG